MLRAYLQSNRSLRSKSLACLADHPKFCCPPDWNSRFGRANCVFFVSVSSTDVDV